MTYQYIRSHEQYEQDVLVVGKNRLAIYPKGTEESFFFHPNSAMFRVKRLMRGENDPFVQTTLERNDSVRLYARDGIR